MAITNIRGSTLPKTDRTRIDYEEMFPNLRTQAFIDHLVIEAVSAMLHNAQHKPWQPLGMWGNDRDRWKLLNSLAPEKRLIKNQVQLNGTGNGFLKKREIEIAPGMRICRMTPRLRQGR